VEPYGVFAMFQMKMSEGGRVVIPAEIRQALGLKEGDPVLFELRDGEAVITTKRARIRRAQEMFRRYVPAGSPSLADELIAERRAEAAREEEEGRAARASRQ
ncbi:MAG: AbrB/MazE/SpoVT family DNA-binding domain-containing protein, partial [Rhodocyclaceae bacterium]|nr:AbrB/MazE/SpoVT family DNA-binding domain-containing protein [Rhodocyclaceae bacterium]